MSKCQVNNFDVKEVRPLFIGGTLYLDASFSNEWEWIITETLIVLLICLALKKNDDSEWKIW